MRLNAPAVTAHWSGARAAWRYGDICSAWHHLFTFDFVLFNMHLNRTVAVVSCIISVCCQS